MSTWIFPLFHLKVGFASGIWGLLDGRFLEIDFPFLSPRFPHQVVSGNQYIEAMIEVLLCDMEPFVVPQQ